MTLYLKYRPQTINQLDLQTVRDRLQSILFANNKADIPHAFLFAGPKGTGKTSAARILAKVVNCEKNTKKFAEPCNKCSQCISITKNQNIDVIELDAASNRGIDDIRSLRERVALSPNSSDYKIYIIDEAHMLTLEAANAFLKTLEEPPAHVIFILATTDPQRLPDTIISRLSVIQFTKAQDSEIARQLDRVIKGEKLKLEKGVIEIITKYAEGSFRDAVKLLEALSTNKKTITLSDAQINISQSNIYQINDLYQSLLDKNKDQALKNIDDLVLSGAFTKVILDRLIEKYRHDMLSSKTSNPAEFAQLIMLLVNAKKYINLSPIDQLPLELAAISWCTKSNFVKSVSDDSLKKKQQKINSGDTAFDPNMWTQILTQTREKNSSVEALLRSTRPISFDGINLTVGVYYRFHKERLEVSQNKIVLEEIASNIFGNNIKVKYTLAEKINSKPAPPDKPLSVAKDQDIIKAAEEIFS